MRLIIEDDTGRRVVVPVEREEITIGRHDSNHVRLHERNVSRRHCRFLRSGDALVVEDLQSSNGLRVNGAPIFGRYQVAPGDRIRVGDYSISVDGAASTTADDVDWLDAAIVEPTQPRSLRDAAAEAPKPPVVSTVAAGDAVPVIARAAPRRVPAPIPPFPLEAFRALQARGLVPTPKAPASMAAPAEPRPSPVLQPAFSLPPLRPAAPAPSKEAARLVVLTTELAGTSVALPAAPAWIGRGPDADLVLDHRSIAERHCRIEPTGAGAFRIARADPSLALSVNGEPGDDAALRPGDTLRIGAMLLRLVSGR